MKVIFETERLLLREYVEDDAQTFFQLNRDPKVLRFVPEKLGEWKTASHIERQKKKKNNKQPAPTP